MASLLKENKVSVQLPLMPHRFLAPWQVGKDDYFKIWRGPGLQESQAKFQFAYDASAVRARTSHASPRVDQPRCRTPPAPDPSRSPTR